MLYYNPSFPGALGSCLGGRSESAASDVEVLMSKTRQM